MFARTSTKGTNAKREGRRGGVLITEPLALQTDALTNWAIRLITGGECMRCLCVRGCKLCAFIWLYIYVSAYIKSIHNLCEFVRRRDSQHLQDVNMSRLNIFIFIIFIRFSTYKFTENSNNLRTLPYKRTGKSTSSKYHFDFIYFK